MIKLVNFVFFFFVFFAGKCGKCLQVKLDTAYVAHFRYSCTNNCRNKTEAVEQVVSLRLNTVPRIEEVVHLLNLVP